MRRVSTWLAIVVMLVSLSAAAVRAQSTLVDSTVYLPLVMRNYNPYAALRTVNAPYYADLFKPDGAMKRFSELALLWFGHVSTTENYADVRIGYSDTDLVFHWHIFDRRLWYDISPSTADIAAWDAATLYLNLLGNSDGAPTTDSYRFVTQLNGLQASFRGNGTTWITHEAVFTTTAYERWEDWNVGGLNNDQNNRGWVLVLRVPLSSLELAGKPADGIVWGLGLAVHDRDTQGGSVNTDKTWPETMDGNAPSSWGRLRFGMPGYTPPISSDPLTITIRHGLNGAAVPDVNVGGVISNQCPGDSNYVWNQWGNTNDHSNTGANVQNQGDLADWPCFAKYFVSFPLTAVPSGKVIRSARLRLHHTGNSGSLMDAETSYVHVFTLAEGWAESTLTWNSAPLALENVSMTMVPTLPGCDYGNSQPCAWREWDVSRAVAQAYATGQTALRLVVYSTDWDYHSGKYFGTSDLDDYYAVSRPTLEVVVGTSP